MTSRWPAASASLASLNDVGDVTITSATRDNTLEYNGVAWVNRTPIRSQLTNEPMGIADDTQWTLEYDAATRTLTATPTGTQDIWVKGVRFSFSSAIVLAHDAADGTYYLQVDDTGTAAFDTSFDFENKAQLAIVVYDSAQTPAGFAWRELHGTVMDWRTHQELHRQIGTYVNSGGGLVSGSFTIYGVSDSTNPALAAIAPAVPETEVWDEDLPTILVALADGGPYTRFYKQWTTGKWIWETGADAPYHQASNVPKYNPSSGGDALVSITNNSYVCYYCVAIPVIDDATDQLFRFVWIPGQTQYTSALPNAAARQAALDLALAEDPRDLDLEFLPSTEFVIHAKIVVEYRTTWTNNDYRLRVAGYQKITGSRANLSGSGVVASPIVFDSNVSITTPASVGGFDPTIETTQRLYNERLAQYPYIPAWATSTAYRVGNLVRIDNKLWWCITAHTSGTFATDLTTNGYWYLVGSGGLAGKLTTTDATATTLNSQTVPSDVACCVTAMVSAFEVATGDAKTWVMHYFLKNVGGTVTATKFSEAGNEDAGASAWTAVLDVSGTSVRIRVTGEALKSILWQGKLDHTWF